MYHAILLGEVEVNDEIGRIRGKWELETCYTLLPVSRKKSGADFFQQACFSSVEDFTSLYKKTRLGLLAISFCFA